MEIRFVRSLLCAAAFLCWAINVKFANGSDTIPSTALKSVDGQALVLGPGTSDRWQVVCFLGTECPLAKLYAGRLQQLSDDFSELGVSFIGINSNHQDTLPEILEYQKTHQLRFSFVRDAGQEIADLLSATRTPEVVVIDAIGVVRYQGRIDDQYSPGVSRGEPNQHDLRDALQALVDNKPVPNPRTVAVGCVIGRSPKPRIDSAIESVTYTRDVAPLLQKHCLECHREDQIGPFALTDYDEIVGWGATLLEVIDNGRMPPWHAAPPHDRFAGSRALSPGERDVIATWIEEGMPQGKLEDLPPEPKFVDGWSLPKEPDAIFEMSGAPMQIPAEGTVDYQYFVIDPGLTEDRWVKAAQVVPGNPAVVHHAICFIRPPDGTGFNGVGWLGAYVPGQRPALLGDRSARKLPAGSKLVFQMHYTPTGRPETDRSRVGIIFADPADVEYEVLTLLAIDQSFEIPPGEDAHQVHGSIDYFPRGGKLLSLMPHMHYRGTAFSVSLDFKNGDRQLLLDVPKYDFNWQHDYRLNQAMDTDPIESLNFVATFDNSADNPANPDPTQTVTWGDQTWEEMAVAFFDVSRPIKVASDSSETVVAQQAATTEQPKMTSKQTAFIDNYFNKFDLNEDGRIYKDELPRSLSAFGFSSLDSDNDGIVDRKDLEVVARNRIRE